MKYIPNLIDRWGLAFHAPLRFFDLIFEKFNNFGSYEYSKVKQFCTYNKSCNEQLAEKYIKKYPNLKEAIVGGFVDNYYGKTVSEDFTNKYYDEISTFLGQAYYFSNRNFSEGFIRKFADKMKIVGVLMSSKNLSNEFFDDFEEKIDKISSHKSFYDILANTTLSEYFLSKFAHKFDIYCWQRISRTFQLSANFIIKFSDKLDFQSIKYNENIPDVVKQNLKVKGYAVDIL